MEIFIRKLLNLVRLILVNLNFYKRFIHYLSQWKVARSKIDDVKNITFICYLDSVWKCELIYFKLKSLNYNVSITVLPVIEDGVIDEKSFRQTKKYFQDFGYNLNPIIWKNGRPNLIKTLENCDKVVFSDCWNLSSDISFYWVLLTKLYYYVPYSHQVSKYNNYSAQYNQIFHNLAEKIFAPQVDELAIFDKYSYSGATNVISTGYPGGLSLKVSKTKTGHSKTWRREGVKKIIWAPHHSINWTSRKYSNFLEMHKVMQEVVSEFSEYVDFAFKPHPMLKSELLKRPDWDEKRVRDYFSWWENQHNTVLAEGNYVDLFESSNALIHDCGSFIAEYMYTKKPHAFVAYDIKIRDYFNPFGQRCFDLCQHIGNELDIRNFVNKVVTDDIGITTRHGIFGDELIKNADLSVELIVAELVKSKSSKCEGR